MTESVGLRFSNLPRMQEERMQESSEQAKHAEALSHRLYDTWKHAERIAQSEMDRTREVEIRTLEGHPEWKAWNSRMNLLKVKVREVEEQEKAERAKLKREVEMIESNISAKSNLVNRLNKELQESMATYNSTIQEKISLEAQLREAKEGEEKARQLLDQLQRDSSGKVDKQRHLESILQNHHQQQRILQQRVNDIEKELSSLQTNNIPSSLQQQYESAISELNSLEEKQQCLLMDIAKCNELVEEAQNAANEHEGLLKSLEEGDRSEEGRLKKAHELVIRSRELRDKASYLRNECLQKVNGHKREQNSLMESRASIQRQIDELMAKQADLDRAFNEHQSKIGGLEDEISCLESDYNEADSFYQKATQELKSMETSFGSGKEGIDRERQLIASFLIKKREAEGEKGRVQSMLSNLDATRNRCNQMINSYQQQMGQFNVKRDDLIRSLSPLQSDLFQAEQEISQMQSEFDQIKRAVSDSEQERKAANEFMINCTHTGRKIKERLAELERVRIASPEELCNRLNHTQGELDSLKQRFEDLQARFNSPQLIPNPYQNEIYELEGKKQSIMTSVKENIHQNPPNELVEQMKRETEVVMRAELASGLYSRQHQIEMEAKSLSQFTPNSTPRFELDQEAKQRLFQEHLETTDHRHIASTLVDLAEKRHILSQ